MSMDEVVRISREDVFHPRVDSALAHQKALARQGQPVAEQPISPLRRLLLSNLFHLPLAGLLGGLTAWLILEPFWDDNDLVTTGSAGVIFYFPLTVTLIVLFIYISNAITSRKLRGNLGRWAAGLGLTLLFSFLAYLPISWILAAVNNLFADEWKAVAGLRSITALPSGFFIGCIIVRSWLWTIMGAALGLGMNLVRSTSAQLRASVMGGVVGGTLGGILFDPINRFLLPNAEKGSLMRVVGRSVVGLCVGVFVAVGERLGRVGWVRVQTGPLAGKAFILYRNPTVIGSSPHSDIYLFKDAGIAPTHAAIYRVGSSYEVEALDAKSATFVNGREVRRQRLSSADQISVSNTILDFEERAKRKASQDMHV
ncbi:MAG TPA: FHA domain-containing protein [Pyrinomonadaceae bacterium]|jgi:hypothetical protein|nr:FHA domain-containing protein [Pyrinomonadaceae bacterium]